MLQLFAGAITLTQKQSEQLFYAIALFYLFVAITVIALATLVILWVTYAIRVYLLKKPSPRLRHFSINYTLVLCTIYVLLKISPYRGLIP